MLKNIYPLVITENLPELKSFYVETMKFEVVFDSDWYIQLQKDNFQIAFMITNSPNQPKIFHKGFSGVGVVITLEFEDIDKEYERLKDHKSVIHKIKTEEWGQRHFLIQDPNGMILDMVQYTKAEDYQ